MLLLPDSQYLESLEISSLIDGDILGQYPWTRNKNSQHK